MKNLKPKTLNGRDHRALAYHLKPNKGFTIIEMLVTISVFIIVTSMILINYPQFSDRLSLERTAQEVALSLREAKTYAIAVREFGIGTDRYPGYGVHFDLSSGPTKEYILFADVESYPLEGNKIYDDDGGGSSDEKIDQFIIQTNVSIKEFCVGINSLTDCSSYEKLEIVYFRPDPDVTIMGTPSGGGITVSIPTGVAIIVETPPGDCKAIIIRVTGQISVKGC